MTRYCWLAKTPVEEGREWSKGLQNTRSAGDSLWGFPRPLPQPFPHSGCVPAETVMWGLLSPAPRRPSCAQQAPDFPPFPLDAAFSSPQGFSKGFASIFMKTPKAVPRVETLGCVLGWGLARAVFSLKHAEFPVVPAPGGNVMGVWVD